MVNIKDKNIILLTLLFLFIGFISTSNITGGSIWDWFTPSACTPGTKCYTNYTQGYQDSNCKWSNFKLCSYGCSINNGQVTCNTACIPEWDCWYDKEKQIPWGPCSQCTSSYCANIGLAKDSYYQYRTCTDKQQCYTQCPSPFDPLCGSYKVCTPGICSEGYKCNNAYPYALSYQKADCTWDPNKMKPCPYGCNANANPNACNTACIPDWDCWYDKEKGKKWSDCSICSGSHCTQLGLASGNYYQHTTCTDLNLCYTTTGKPAESRTCTPGICSEGYKCNNAYPYALSYQKADCTWDPNKMKPCPYGCNANANPNACNTACIPDWKCTDWSTCANCTNANICNNLGYLLNRYSQTRTCTDNNQCGTSCNNDPNCITTKTCTSTCEYGQTNPCTAANGCSGTQNCYLGSWTDCTSTLTKCPDGQCKTSCTPSGCTPNWQCYSWSSCINQQQTRTCYDTNNCGTITGKPAETQTCTPGGGTCAALGQNCEWAGPLINGKLQPTCCSGYCVNSICQSSPPPPCTADPTCGGTRSNICSSQTCTDSCGNVYSGTKNCAQCTDECTSGSKQCYNSTAYKTCGNYDQDSCTELSTTKISCPSDKTCSNGICTSSSGGLDELQFVACEAADTYNTCDKLKDLNIVTKEECCSELELCCDNQLIDQTICKNAHDADLCYGLDLTYGSGAITKCCSTYSLCCSNVLCTNGQTQKCGVSNIGECRFGTQTCSNQHWGICKGAISPIPEIEDGKDNDCDNIIDETNDTTCITSQVVECSSISNLNYTSPSICKKGKKICVNNATATWSKCYNETLPAATEICHNDLDDDCDGKTDSEDTTCKSVASHCNNNKKDSDETGIDCGGSCPSCHSCYDGILNQGEENIQQNVANGIISDCGGIHCPACPTCDDNTKNQDETGIDCGGSCPSCKQINIDSDKDGLTDEQEEEIGTDPLMKDSDNDGLSDSKDLMPLCPNNFCDIEFSETSENCPEDCPKEQTFPTYLILIIVIFVLLLILFIGYYLFKKSNKKGSQVVLKKQPPFFRQQQVRLSNTMPKMKSQIENKLSKSLQEAKSLFKK